MNKILFIIFITSLKLGHSQKKTYINLKENINTSVNFIRSNDTFNVLISINSFKELKELNDSLNFKYYIIYTYAPWCKPCREFLPLLIKKYSKNKDIQLLLITMELKNIKILYKTVDIFLKKDLNYKNPTFFIKLPNKSAKWKKNYYNFIKNIVKRDHEYGLSFLSVLDRNSEIIFETASYLNDKNSILEIIDKKVVLKDNDN